MARRRPPTRNNALADSVRTHTVRLFRFSTSLNGRVQQRLTGVRADLVKILAEGDPTEPTRAGDRINRVNAVSAEARRVVAHRYRGINRLTAGELTDLADVDQSIVARLIEQTSGDRGITTLPARQLERIVDRALVDGAPSSDWWRRQAADVVKRYHDQVRQGMQAGESVGDLIRRVRGTAAQNYQDGVMAMPQHAAEALIRSSTLSVVNDVRAAEFAENSDIIAGRVFTATMDTRVCPVCIAYSGAVYDHDGNPLPESPVQLRLPTDGPPLHWACRCTWVVYLRGEEPPQDIEFEPWLDDQSVEEQREILGPARYELWKSGELQSLHGLVDQRGRPLTLDQIREAAREAA